MLCSSSDQMVMGYPDGRRVCRCCGIGECRCGEGLCFTEKAAETLAPLYDMPETAQTPDKLSDEALFYPIPLPEPRSR